MVGLDRYIHQILILILIYWYRQLDIGINNNRIGYLDISYIGIGQLSAKILGYWHKYWLNKNIGIRFLYVDGNM